MESVKAQYRPDFLDFHKNNPEVWALFAEYAHDAIRVGKKTLSAKLIMERIRWEQYIQTEAEDGFKLNNNFSADYARLFNEQYPQYKGMFRTRARTAHLVAA